MSYSDKGEQERAEAERSSAGMMRLFGQMILLPFTVFVFGIELFARTIRELQKTTDRGMDLLAGETAPLSEDLSTSEGPNSALSAAPSPSMTGGWGDLKSQTTTSTDDGVGDDAEVTDKETTMRDKDLSDDQLKLVRYKILFVKRDYETAFPEKEEMVADNMTGDAFAAWKVAEFIQQLGDNKDTVVPPDWMSGDRPKYPEDPKYTQKANGRWVLLGLPERDKKYLRVYFEVLERYVREEDEDTDVDVLREIRDAINKLNKPGGSYAAGSPGGGSPGGGSPGGGAPGGGGGGGYQGGGGPGAGGAGGGPGYNP